ncbi:MAG: zinc-binding dehydrogenase, partial [Pseudomonadota bacterium]
QKRHQGILKFLSEKVGEGKIRPLVEKRKFELSEINEAHAYYESGQHLGKIVINNAGLNWDRRIL